MMVFMNTIMDGPVEEHEGAKPTPTEAADDMLSNLITKVLATVRCGGWKADWCEGFMTMLLKTFSCCSNVRCCAVKGGPATDAEILMALDMLAQLGFECDKDAEDSGSS